MCIGLVHSREADAQIEGDRAFHITSGYQKLLDIFLEELKGLNVPIHLNTVVSDIKWRSGPVQVEPHSSAGQIPYSAARALITFPLGVLQSNSVRFAPDLPGDKHIALEKLAMGKVIRVTLCFRESFWQELKPEGERKTLAGLSFLFSRDQFFPTWWTKMPEEIPVITGWAPAHSAELLAGMSEGRVIDKALNSLSSLLCLKKSQIESQLSAAYFHNWDSDPFSRGAYSYVKVGGEGCQRTLSEPIDNTLFFAGVGKFLKIL